MTPLATRLLILAEASLTALIFHLFIPTSVIHPARSILFVLVLGLTYLGVGLSLRVPNRRWAEFAPDLVQVLEIMAVVYLVAMAVEASLRVGAHAFAQAAVLSVGVIALERFALRLGLRQLRRLGRNRRYVLVVGEVDGARLAHEKLGEHPELGLSIVDVLSPRETDAIREALRNRVVDVVLVAMAEFTPTAALAVDLGRAYGKDVKMLLDPRGAFGAFIETQDFFGAPLVTLGSPSTIPLGLAGKRILDVVLAGLSLVLASPILLVAAVAIKLDDPAAPVLYRQVRIGLNGRRFELLKLRTMVPNAEKLRAGIAHLNEMDGPVFKVRNDPRVTRPGRWLRRLSIDELPQIWNVLRGEMSLVGPRPPLPQEVAQYPDRFRRRLSVRPGVTGAWQVSGRNEVQFESWMEMDLDYIDHWSLTNDLRILAKTIPSVLSGRGAS